jgi:CheY-like chemotaxis protein
MEARLVGAPKGEQSPLSSRLGRPRQEPEPECGVPVMMNCCSAGLPRGNVVGPDVVLVDIGLPDLDDYEVGRRLRATLGPSVRLIALTGYGQDQDRQRPTTRGSMCTWSSRCRSDSSATPWRRATRPADQHGRVPGLGPSPPVGGVAKELNPGTEKETDKQSWPAP